MQTTRKGHNKQQHLIIYKKEEKERERERERERKEKEKKYGCTKIMC